MRQTIVQVDSFTDRPFGGNPAAVCVLPRPGNERWMQSVAAEMNLSETAFVHPEGAPGLYRLRWFTPTVEVDLCGHATLATAHVLWTEGHLPEDAPARFQTLSGPLTAERHDGWITLDFPATPATKAVDPEALAEIVQAPARFVGQSSFDGFVELDSEAAVLAVAPDLPRLAALPFRGLIVTARASSPGFDFVSRFFAPRVGIAEDPVCGSAHCSLGPYWGERLGKADLMAYQASARGGVLRVGLRGSRILLGGQAVTVLKGEILGDA
ncbi:MAG: PhzF family phenazine biosynthesis protein [Isosphaeraceae bacterium]